MVRNKSSRFFISAGTLRPSLPAFSADLPKARPKIVGLSSARLERLGAVMQTVRRRGPGLGGAVTLIARNGRVAYLHPFGKLDPTEGARQCRPTAFSASPPKPRR